MNWFIAKLPSSPLGPVHILSPKIYKYIMDGIVLLIVLAIFFWLLKKVFAHNPIETEASRLNKYIRKTKLDIFAEIENIKKKYNESDQIRNAFFRLAYVLRSYYHTPNQNSVESMTAEEINKKIKEKEVASIFTKISEKQYNVEEPTPEDLENQLIEVRKTARKYKKINQVQ